MDHHTLRNHRNAHKTFSLLVLVLIIAPFYITACNTQKLLAPYTHALPNPQIISAKVLRVLDGDTIDVSTTSEPSTLRIRLQGIDAPEKTQPYGIDAQKRLASLILDQDVILATTTTDSYGRTIAKVTFNNEDICLEIIRSGYAWWFRRYQQTQSTQDRILYGQAEDKSREQQIGLWAEPNPVPPWTYRQENRQKQDHAQLIFILNLFVPQRHEQQWKPATA